MVQSEQSSDHGQVAFHWSFPESTRYQRDKNWYWTAGLVVAGLLLYSLLTRNFLFALLVILATLTIIMFQRNIKEVDFQITEDGILVNNKFYDYKAVKNFYIIYEPPAVKSLYFELKSFFSPRIPVNLTNQDPVKIREFLLRYIAEDIERENEPTSDQFSRLFKL